MQPNFHKIFKKQYEKLPRKIQEKVKERLNVFNDNPFSPGLSNHPLHGKYKGCRSINISGDLRAVYEIREESVTFILLDTHSNLY